MISEANIAESRRAGLPAVGLAARLDERAQIQEFEILPMVPKVAIVKVTTTPTGFFGNAIHSLCEKECGHYASVACLPHLEPKVGELVPCLACYAAQRDRAVEDGLEFVRLPGGSTAWLRPEVRDGTS